MSLLRVLLVDDNVTDLELMVAAFEECLDVQLTTHTHAPSALHWVEDQVSSDRLPHLVLLDLHMPGMDGLAWLQAIRQQPALSQLPVLLYSLTPSDLQQQVEQLQVCGYWQKPMTLSEMQNQAERLCAIWERDHGFTSTTLQRVPSAVPVT